MFHQVEDAEHPDDPKNEHDLDDQAFVQVARLQRGVLENHLHVQRHQGQQVDDVHRRAHEPQLVGRKREPEYQFQREEHRADDVEDVERFVGRHHYGDVAFRVAVTRS